MIEIIDQLDKEEEKNGKIEQIDLVKEKKKKRRMNTDRSIDQLKKHKQ